MMRSLSHTLQKSLQIAALILLATSARAEGTAFVVELDGALGVATAEYIIGAIDDAEERGANVLIIRMDTPGGLMEPMRDIVMSILGSSIPVATYVSPGGARADSAGTYILLASHIAAMAPTTHVGAATPVSLTGDDPGKQPRDDDGDERPPANENDGDSSDGEDAGDDADPAAEPGAPDSAMGRKVLNDAISYIRGLAEAHGRNADWAEDAVRNAATLTATEALELNVIDLIAANESELLEKMHGREVRINNQMVVIDTEALTIERIEPNWRLKVLNTIASPEIAVLLLMVGLYGLLFEGYNPGAILPGVAGVICLLLAAYALQVLPVNYAGLALIIVGLLLITAEAFVPSFGVLGLGGLVAFIFGSIMMFDSGIPGFDISVTFVITLAVASGGLLLWMLSYLVKLQRRGAVSGKASIVGGTGVAIETFFGEGKVWLEGEAWHARSRVQVNKDQEVVVRNMDGLVLDVEPLAASDRDVPGAGESNH
jgi:membrane-bound serine protease (ClpP class)